MCPNIRTKKVEKYSLKLEKISKNFGLLPFGAIFDMCNSLKSRRDE